MTGATHVGVIPGDGIVVRRGPTVLVISVPSAVSPELPDRLIDTISTHDGARRVRQLARHVLAETDPPAVAVVTLDADDHGEGVAAEVFLFGDLELVRRSDRVSGSDHVLGVSTTVPRVEGFAIVPVGDPVPALAAWNRLDAGSVRGDGVVVSAPTGAPPAPTGSPVAGALDPPMPDDAATAPPAPPDGPLPHAAGPDADGESDSTGPMAAVGPDDQGESSGGDVAPFESVPLTTGVDLTGRAPLPIAGDAPTAPAADEVPAYERPVQVIGVFSPRGFFNHPDARYCSRTGVKMGASHTKVLTTGPRPPLGVLTLDDGATLTVRWNTVLGRDPVLDERVQRGEAAPFVISDVAQSVSRRHALLELVDWDVLISDLGSRNRTVIQAGPDEPRRPLAAGERAVLHSGAIVHLGDRSFIYNEHHVR